MATDEHLHKSHKIPHRMNVNNIPDIEHIPTDISPQNLEFLKGLIETFNTSTARLKDAYAALHEKFDVVNIKLEETNKDLSRSLLEQERLSNYLTSILESLSSGVLVVNTEGKLTLFNRGAESITGIRVEDAINRHYYEVMGEETPEELTPIWTLSTGEGYSQIEKNVTSRDGKTIPVGCSISPLVNKAGERIGAVEIFMDLTRIKALEEELAQKEKLAALGQMAATMAHKIRNPLGGIAGFAGLIQLELQGNENGRRLIGKIIEGVNKLNRIVTTLLTYTSSLRLNLQSVDLGTIAGEIIRTIKDDHEGVRFSLDQPEGDVMVIVDAEQLRTAVKNIIQNAVEALGDRGEVNIAVVCGESYPRLSIPLSSHLADTIWESSKLLKSHKPCGILIITDSGKGMGIEEKENLFVPFYTTKEYGIGLGLAIARKIVEAHHGELWIESDEHHGTSVGIVLQRV